MRRTHLLHFEAAVNKILAKAHGLGLTAEKPFWSAYRHLRKLARRNSLDERDAREWIQLVHTQRIAYLTLVLALKLANAYTLQRLARQGPATRAQRALLKEHFNLLKKSLQQKLGLKSSLAEPSWHWPLGASFVDRPDVYWIAQSDGALQKGLCAAGIHLKPPGNQPALQKAVALPRGPALSAELHACVLTLKELLSVGATHAVVRVDSLGVLKALEGKLPLHYAVLEAQLHRLALRFEELHVYLSPRTMTRDADALARNLLHSSN